jgi:hypothetical protein
MEILRSKAYKNKTQYFKTFILNPKEKKTISTKKEVALINHVKIEPVKVDMRINYHLKSN